MTKPRPGAVRGRPPTGRAAYAHVKADRESYQFLEDLATVLGAMHGEAPSPKEALAWLVRQHRTEALALARRHAAARRQADARKAARKAARDAEQAATPPPAPEATPTPKRGRGRPRKATP
jgi:hypothetical protein